MAEALPPSDRIILEGMQFYGFHGVNQEERVLGQSYLVDLSVELDLSRAGDSDKLEDTVSYSGLYREVRDVVEGDPRNLLESTAQAIASRVLEKFPVRAVGVRVKKPHPPSPWVDDRPRRRGNLPGPRLTRRVRVFRLSPVRHAAVGIQSRFSEKSGCGFAAMVRVGGLPVHPACLKLASAVLGDDQGSGFPLRRE